MVYGRCCFHDQDHMTLTTIVVPSAVIASICHVVHVVSAQLILNLGTLPVAVIFGGTPTFLSVGVSFIVNPWMIYDEMFNNRPKVVVVSMPNDLYGQKYLKTCHLQTLRCYNHNLIVVHLWFIGKSDNNFQRFYATNYQHDKEDNDISLDYTKNKNCYDLFV